MRPSAALGVMPSTASGVKLPKVKLPKVPSPPWLAPAILCLGLGFSMLAMHGEWRQAETIVGKEFDLASMEVRTAIQDRLACCAQVLRSGAALFDTLGTVSREEWRTFTRSLDIARNLPGIQGVGYSPIIPHDRLESHLAEIRSQGFPDYRVLPEGERDQYTSIVYLEPFSDRNLRAFGYDMFSEPVSRAAMEQARDGASAVLSGKVVLVQETSQDLQAGTLLYLPVYRRGAPVATVDERRAAIQGWVYSPYRMTDLMRGIFGELERKYQGSLLRLQIYDGSLVSETGLKEAGLLYDSQASSAPSPAAKEAFSRLLPIEAAGRAWTLRFGIPAGSGFVADYRAACLLGLGGSLVSLLLAGLVLSLSRSRDLARRMALDLTSELRAREENYRSVFENMEEGLAVHEVITDDSGRPVDYRFLEANEAFGRHTGQKASGLIGRTLREIRPAADSLQIENFGRVALSGEPLSFEYYSKVLDRHLQVRAFSPLPGRFATLYEDISHRKRAEVELREALSENRGLLSELQHRVKNSFTMIASMIGLASDASASTETAEVLSTLDQRVSAVSALYSLLYTSGSFTELRLDEYCLRVADAVIGLSGRVSLETELAEVTVSAKQAAPIGLIVTELMTNALKYAFPGDRTGTITLSLAEIPAAGIVLRVVDDGGGLPPGFDPGKDEGLGLRLVKGLAAQIGGSFAIEGDATGTRCTLAIPAPEAC